jgi:hypothetical protein
VTREAARLTEADNDKENGSFQESKSNEGDRESADDDDDDIYDVGDADVSARSLMLEILLITAIPSIRRSGRRISSEIRACRSWTILSFTPSVGEEDRRGGRGGCGTGRRSRLDRTTGSGRSCS